MTTTEPEQTQTKNCYRCKEDRLITDFYVNLNMKDGRLNLCRFCKVEEATKWRKENTHAFNIARRKRDVLRYGITWEEYLALSTKQKHRCRGCRKKHDPLGPGRIMAVDHCHETKKVRGLLCRQCNLAVGNAGDDSTTLRRLANYLDEARRA